MSMRFPRLLPALLALAGLSWAECAHAQASTGFEVIWSLGAVDDRPDEFGDSIWGTSAAPGSATALDDDF
jgi:hypothetical protein